MRQLVIAAKIQYSVEGVITTLGVSSVPYFADASGLLNRTWYPILDRSVRVSVDVSLPWGGGSPSQSIGDILLINGGDGEYQRVLDMLISAQLAGLVTEVRRGYTDQAWDDLPDIVFISRNDGRRFDGEQLVIPQRPLRDLDQPINNEVFDEGTPNQRLVNQTVPNVLGEVFQIEPLIEDPPNQRYFSAGNLAATRQAQTGGNVTDNWAETDTGHQMTAGSNLVITAHIAGPQKPDAALSEVIGPDGGFPSFTNGVPDGWTTEENPPDSDISPNATAGADVVATTPVADASTDNVPTVASAPPPGAGSSLLGLLADDTVVPLSDIDQWPALIDADDGERIRWTLGGANKTGQRLTLTGFGASIADVPVGVEVKIRADHDGAGIDFEEIRIQAPGGTLSENKAGDASLTTTKTQHVFGSSTDTWGLLLGAETFGEGFGVRLNFRTAPTGAFPREAKVYEVIVTIHTGSGAQSVRLYKSVLSSGGRYRITINHDNAGNEISARWFGVQSVGDPIPWVQTVAGGVLSQDLSDSARDPFSTFWQRLSDQGTASHEFVADGPVFGLEFFKLPGQTGQQTILQVEVEELDVALNSYTDLVPYMADRIGLVDAVDQASINAHDAAVGSPALGWYLNSNESMAEVMDLFARSLSGVWWNDRDGQIRSVLWTLDPDATPDVTISNITVDGKPQRIRIDGNITLESDPAERATERAVGARNWRPLRVSETAGITEEFSEQERANVIEDWRVRRRANFDNLNPWPAATPVLSLTSISPTTGDPAGGTSVTITGENFDPGASATVTFDGVSATNIVVVSATEITCTTPAGTVGTVDVLVTQGSESDTLAGAFEYTATSSAWTPADITTALWLDADDPGTITLDSSDDVIQWDDKSGNARHHTPLSDPVPFDAAAPGVVFDGNGNPLSSADWSVSLTSQAVFVVYEWTTGTARFARSFTQTSGGANDHLASDVFIPNTRDDGASSFGSQSTSSVVVATRSVAQDTRIIWGTVHNGTQISNRVNGGAEATSSDTMTRSFDQSLVGGALPQQALAHLAGPVHEVIVLNNQSVAESLRQKIEGYLAHKWGLEASLPADHPHKSSPP